MRILGLDDILKVLPGLDVVDIIEQSFVAYSAGQAVVPPPGELVFTEPPGDVHIKYGYIHGEEHYVVKIASGFHRNVDLGLPNGNGLMLVFSSRTGAMEALLLDDGHLTDIRTGAAGAVAARHLARGDIARIGVFGTGTQAR